MCLLLATVRARDGVTEKTEKWGKETFWEYSGRWCCPMGHFLLCLHWRIVSVPINLLALWVKAGKEGWIRIDRHGLVTWEVRSGFNWDLGAVGTLTVWLWGGWRSGGQDGVYMWEGWKVRVCMDGVLYVSVTRRGRSWPACLWSLCIQ